MNRELVHEAGLAEAIAAREHRRRVPPECTCGGGWGGNTGHKIDCPRNRWVASLAAAIHADEERDRAGAQAELGDIAREEGQRHRVTAADRRINRGVKALMHRLS